MAMMDNEIIENAKVSERELREDVDKRQGVIYQVCNILYSTSSMV